MHWNQQLPTPPPLLLQKAKKPVQYHTTTHIFSHAIIFIGFSVSVSVSVSVSLSLSLSLSVPFLFLFFFYVLFHSIKWSFHWMTATLVWIWVYLCVCISVFHMIYYSYNVYKLWWTMSQYQYWLIWWLG